MLRLRIFFREVGGGKAGVELYPSFCLSEKLTNLDAEWRVWYVEFVPNS